MTKPDLAVVPTLAGRELDAAVHRHLMGRECEWFSPTPGEFGSDLNGLYDTPLNGMPHQVSYYSSNFAALEPMIEAVRAKGWRVHYIGEQDNGGWGVWLEGPGCRIVNHVAETLPLAFARAALMTTYTESKP